MFEFIDSAGQDVSVTHDQYAREIIEENEKGERGGR